MYKTGSNFVNLIINSCKYLGLHQLKLVDVADINFIRFMYKEYKLNQIQKYKNINYYHDYTYKDLCLLYHQRLDIPCDIIYSIYKYI